MDALGAEVIPSPTAAGDFTRRFGEGDVVGMQEAFNAVRPRLWLGRGRDLLAPVAYVDVDGTLAPTLGDKKDGMDMSYKGVWGYHPLVISLANTGEVLYIVNRPGNVVSHDGAAEWIGKAIGLVAPHVERVCVRGDTDFSLTANFDRWSEYADFIFGYDSQPGMVRRAKALEAGDRERLERRPRYTSRTGKTRSRREDVKARIVRERGYVNKRLNYEDVAEYEYRPGKCRKTYRMVVVRKNISKMKGDLTLLDEIRYFFYITTRRDLSAAEVVRLANARCDQENVIAQLKSGVGALRVPVYDLVSNWAYMVMAALAWNLKSWLAMMMHLKTDRRKYVAMEFRRFVREMILLPCQVIRRARQTPCASSAGSRRPTGCSARGARSNGPASGSAATLPLRPFAALPCASTGPLYLIAEISGERSRKFASTCHFIPRNLRHGPLCGLQVRLMPTRTAETRPRALLACFRSR